MDGKNKTFFALIAISISLALVVAASSTFVQAPKPFYGFYVIMPDLVEIAPGNEMVVHGGVQNFGFYWEHNVVVNVTGLPEEFNATPIPGFYEHLRTLREWNPQQGLYYIPEKLDVDIKVPADATPGVYPVNVSLMDMQSARHPANFTVFILRVTGEAPTEPMKISDIAVPESVQADTPFNISFSVINGVSFEQSVNMTVQLPEDWRAMPPYISDSVPSNSSKNYYFTITPTNSSGSFSIVLQYPFQGIVLNVTKTGPFLTVGGTQGGGGGIPGLPGINLPSINLPSVSFPSVSLPSIPNVSFPAAPISGSAFSQAVAFASANPLLTVVVVVVVAVLVYYVYSSYTFDGSRRKPEEMKKPTEISELRTEIVGKE